MVIGLITPEEQEKLYKKIIEYYQNLYPGIEFKVDSVELTHQQIGELLYTYAGEETEATAAEKMRMISEAIGHGYNTPIVVIRKAGMDIMLDGHRRMRVAYPQGISWKVTLIIPSIEDVTFGIEEMVLGKVKDLWGGE